MEMERDRPSLFLEDQRASLEPTFSEIIPMGSSSISFTTDPLQTLALLDQVCNKQKVINLIIYVITY